mmetsp:Transcript_27814/g.66241  ORF Transcript_27814/g.66241 Transcript_27814/m.66241 type:complete len:303 (+) Transcript_27814:193-1101(+)|eukprot:CAMPEP_0180152618 /NCGR_PEP_ID=MMETSP0986-20121125/22923_1 /TAXON_ID=697907 /ORGANISM="non described non described, Strain CCMP2293" /LENGTH=302 /DNA_ID=CAMNT_0022100321 /DNA_START=178 /DNA_END=1086 /DNA_ORIENTATION=-
MVLFGRSNDAEPDDITLDLEEGGGAVGQSSFMTAFFDKVSQVRRNMTQIKKNMGNIEKKHGAALTSVSSAASNKRQEELEDMMDQTSTLISAVKETLKEMDSEGKEHAKKAGRSGDSESRIRQNLQSTLTKKFIALVQEYQDMQTQYKNKYRDRVGRQLKVVKPDASAEEIDKILEDGSANAIFTQELLADRSSQAAKNALADIQDKHRDIMRLEQSIVELHQLFVDMSVLVETQGEMLDQIEYSVQQAHAYVDKGVQQLEKAKKSQKTSRNRMCCIMCCLTVGLMIVVGVVFGGLMGAGQI